jgi:glycogen debranching enzyme
MPTIERVEHAIAHLKTERADLYTAAWPGYTSVFPRDQFYYAFLANDIPALKAGVAFSAEHQGTRSDAMTGEEFGKMPHEFPGVLMRERISTYNACDTSALFLLAMARLANLEQQSTFPDLRDHAEAAISYINSHIYDGLFHEDTKQSGADRFGLNVTYWKDSELNTENGAVEPKFPVVYSLAHFQNAMAMLEAGQMLGDEKTQKMGAFMISRGLQELWKDDHFVVAKQADGLVADPPSSDSLHSLYFIPPGLIDGQKVQAIEDYSRKLETAGGYLPTVLNKGVEVEDDYHTRYVWTHEQAVIHEAARRHKLNRALTVSAGIIPVFEHEFPELADAQNDFTPAGNLDQLWGYGAYLHFANLGMTPKEWEEAA